MKLKLLILNFLIMILGVDSLYAQFVYSDMIYSPVIKTVKLESKNADLSLPIARLGEYKSLILKFDEIGEETNRYEYTIIHCNSDWTPSELEPYEYIEGFETEIIENFSNSFNTLCRYVHYEQTIPSETMRPTKSGNYIIKVFHEGEPDKVIFTKKIYCLDLQTATGIEIKPTREPSLRNKAQEVEVVVRTIGPTSLNNPYQDVKVLIQQNGRLDNQRFLPLNESIGKELHYRLKPENIFLGGNEFRQFDFTSLRHRTAFIENIDYVGGENIVRLKPEQIKTHIPYVSYSDINGAYYVRNDIGESPELGSDYAWVCFYLPAQLNMEGNYYAVGEMSQWRLGELNRFVYDSHLNCYTLKMLLKQGYYNYQILFRPHNSLNSTTKEIEGDHFETENTYTAFVYYRELGNNYESLIGFTTQEVNW
jgi:hypothetical protein